MLRLATHTPHDPSHPDPIRPHPTRLARLAKKELELLSKENALLEKEQSITVLRQELEIERKLRGTPMTSLAFSYPLEFISSPRRPHHDPASSPPELVTKEKEDAEEEALLSKSLCTGSTMLP